MLSRLMGRNIREVLLFPVCTLSTLLVTISTPAQAIPFEVNMTVDNSFALFYGVGTAATNFVDSNFHWTTTATYNFDLPDDHFLYVVTASDTSVAQGFLGEFENLNTGDIFFSSDPQWQVTATGLGSDLHILEVHQTSHCLQQRL